MKSVYDNVKKDCAGCYTCFNTCPLNAISMQTDEDGFIFPKIDQSICIDCGQCKKVCDFQDEINYGNYQIKTFAAINKNNDILMKSSSGGAFTAIAEVVLDKDGVVFGCQLSNNLKAEHIYVDSKEKLYKMCGSKYVQSDIGTAYKKIKELLNNNKYILFSGTPCQVAGLKKYLGQKYDKLITVDLICHGVPSQLMLHNYLQYEEKHRNKTITKISFRTKNNNWLDSLKLQINDDILFPAQSYYYNFFLNGWIYRDSCYKCKYANDKRQGDFTIGDYWGIEKIQPEIDIEKGVSLLTVNTTKAQSLITDVENKMYLYESDYKKAQKYNQQLNIPTKKSVEREKILKISREKGAKGLAKYHKKRVLVYNIGKLMPISLKHDIKKILHRA